MLNEARFSWIRRDLQFPENDPDFARRATITGFFTHRRAQRNFPQGRVQDSFQLADVATDPRGTPLAQVRRRHPAA